MVDKESNLFTVPPNTEEFEIFEGRFQTTREEIATVCDNFIQSRDYDGIAFQDFQIGWAGDQRIYNGVRKDDNDQHNKSILLGFVEVSSLKNFSVGGVRIRIVCVWPPLLRYWEELPGNLADIFLVIESESRIFSEESTLQMDLTQKKPGRPTDTLYDNAYERLLAGDDPNEVFQWYCDDAGIKNPDKNARDSYKAAMKRRHK